MLTNSKHFSLQTQALPEPVLFWEKASEETIIEHNPSKYFIETTTVDMYNFRSVLTIKNIDKKDHGVYHCHSKNTLGQLKISFIIGDSNRTDYPLIAGVTPKIESYEDTCPTASPCKICPQPK